MLFLLSLFDHVCLFVFQVKLDYDASESKQIKGLIIMLFLLSLFDHVCLFISQVKLDYDAFRRKQMKGLTQE